MHFATINYCKNIDIIKKNVNYFLIIIFLLFDFGKM